MFFYDFLALFSTVPTHCLLPCQMMAGYQSVPVGVYASQQAAQQLPQHQQQQQQQQQPPQLSTGYTMSNQLWQ